MTAGGAPSAPARKLPEVAGPKAPAENPSVGSSVRQPGSPRESTLVAVLRSLARTAAEVLAMATFISVQLKKTSEVDLAKPLVKFIQQTYPSGGEEQAQYCRAAEELSKLRRAALGRPLDKHEGALETLLRWARGRAKGRWSAACCSPHPPSSSAFPASRPRTLVGVGRPALAWPGA